MPRKTCRPLNGTTAPVLGFNEAAARCRGKPSHDSSGRPGTLGFNEAAARCRGKRFASCFPSPSVCLLQ